MPHPPRKDHPAELAPQLEAVDDSLEAFHGASLYSLMAFYESDEAGYEEDNEIDMTFELNGITYGAQND